MRRDDQSVLALDSVHEVAQRGNGGVGAGSDSCDNADGMSHFHQTQLGDLLDDTDGLLVLQIIIEHGGSIGVLADLVLVVAQTGLVDGQTCQRHCVLIDDLCAFVNQLVNLLLGVTGDFVDCYASSFNIFLNSHDDDLLFINSVFVGFPAPFQEPGLFLWD